MQVKIISKQLKVPAKDIVAFLNSSGKGSFDEGSYLSEEIIVFLRRHYEKNSSDALCGSSGLEPVLVEDMSVGDLANRLQCSVNNLIVELLKRGIVAAKNQVVKKESIAALLSDLGVATVGEVQDDSSSLERVVEKKASGGSQRRLPVISVVGHVDHGKTTLLDFLRRSKVADKEKGGITQNVSAYEVATSQGNLVFLDTPGHEAFSMMRERGVLLADLVVLVVALDDGVKPQTVESIKKIQEFGTSVVVALTKADKAKDDRVEVVKRQLADYGMLPDDWGGDVPCVKISAKTGDGVDELLEVVRLQADILDLKTSETEPAQGFVLESMMTQGRGATATVILHKGLLCRGDSFICGRAFGRVSSLKDSYGKSLKCVKPSVPVIVSGFSELPEAGDLFEFATSAQVKKHKSGLKKHQPSFVGKQSAMGEGKSMTTLIVKAGTHLSKEALLSSLNKLADKYDGKLKVIAAEIGDINDGNLELAATTGAVIYGLNAKVDKSALSKKPKSVDVRTFDIIYKLLEDVEELLESNKEAVVVETQIGTARVKAIFNIKSVGIVAGAAVESGALQKGALVRVLRSGEVIGKGVIKTLQKERSAVSSISAGSDCAFSVDGFSKWAIGDEIYCYMETVTK